MRTCHSIRVRSKHGEHTQVGRMCVHASIDAPTIDRNKEMSATQREHGEEEKGRGQNSKIQEEKRGRKVTERDMEPSLLTPHP